VVPAAFGMCTKTKRNVLLIIIINLPPNVASSASSFDMNVYTGMQTHATFLYDA
jgi:hypothetical protein